MTKTQAETAIQRAIKADYDNFGEQQEGIAQAKQALSILTSPIMDEQTAQASADEAQAALDRLAVSPEANETPKETQAQLDKRCDDYKGELHENVRDAILDGVCQSIMESVKGHIDRRVLMATARERVYNECFCLHKLTAFTNPAFIKAYGILIHELHSMTCDLGAPD